MSAWSASRAARALMRFSRARVASICAAATLTPSCAATSSRALVVELAREQRRALADGQVGQVVDEAPQGLLAPQHGFGVLAVVGRGDELGLERLVAPARAPHLVDRAVAGEAVQPRAQLVGDVAGEQRRVRADEHVLDDVLGVVLGAAQERAGIADEGLAMTRVDGGEGFAVAGGDAAGEVGIVVTGSVQDGDHAQSTLAPRPRRAAGALGCYRTSP